MRLDQASTYRGILMILTAIGIEIEPEYVEHIVALGISLSGLIGVFINDKIGE